MGNQLRALEAGLAVARVLGRMLVVPDYISDNGEGDTLNLMFCTDWNTFSSLRYHQASDEVAYSKIAEGERTDTPDLNSVFGMRHIVSSSVWRMSLVMIKLFDHSGICEIVVK